MSAEWDGADGDGASTGLVPRLAVTRDSFMGQVAAAEFALGGTVLLAATGPYVKVYGVATGELLCDVYALSGTQILGLRVQHDTAGHRARSSGATTVDAGSLKSRQLVVLAFGSRNLSVLTIHVDYATTAVEVCGSTALAASVERICEHGPFPDWIKDVAWIPAPASDGAHPHPRTQRGLGRQHDTHPLARHGTTRQQDTHAREQYSAPTQRLDGDDNAQANAAVDCKFTIALVYAHNFIEIRCLDLTAADNSLLWRRNCEVKCLLYSARIQTTPPPSVCQVVVAVGTVFNQVHLWTATVDQDGDCAVQAQFVGHEGVIFSVRYSADGTQLASVSDDRTARLWSIDGSNAPVILYGHSARVWDCIVTGEHAVTISEDCSCRVWDLTTARTIYKCSGHSGKGIWALALSQTHVATGGNDHGICLREWLPMVCESEWATFETKYILPPGNEVVPRKQKVAKMAPITRMAVSHDGIFAVCKNGTLHVATANPGRPLPPTLFTYAADNNYCGSNCVSLTVSDCGTLMACGDIAGGIAVYACGSYRKLVHQTACWHGKIFSLRLCSRGHNDSWQLLVIGQQQLPVQTADESLLCVRSFILTQSCRNGEWEMNSGLDFKLQTYDVYPASKADSAVGGLPLAMSVALTDFSSHGLAPLCAVGLRHGAIAVFNALTGSQLVYLTGAHHRDAVSDLKFLPCSVSGTDYSMLLWSCGRDGFVRLSRLEWCSDSDGRRMLDVSELHLKRLTKGWVDAISVCRQSGDVLFGYFWDKRFTVHNHSSGHDLFSVSCGGGNRQFYMRVRDVDSGSMVQFTYLRCNVVHQVTHVHCTQDGPRRAVQYLNDGKLAGNGCVFHGRETRCVLRVDIDGQELLATGGEDCSVGIYQQVVQPSNKSVRDTLRPLRLVASLQKHSSCVSDIGCVKIASRTHRQRLLFSCGACEDIRATLVTLEQDPRGISAVQLSMCPLVSSLPDTRVMSVAAVPVAEIFPGRSFCDRAMKHGVILAAVYSDSKLRLWLYDDSDDRRFYIVGSGENKRDGRCFLSVRQWPVATRGTCCFITADTGGYITVWNVTDDIRAFMDEYSNTNTMNAVRKVDRLSSGPIRVQSRHNYRLSDQCVTARLRRHQSGVKSMDALMLPRRADLPGSSQRCLVMVATGGDDNAVRLATICGDSCTIVHEYSIPANVHASSVQAVQLVQALDAVFLLTVALDRRLIVWRVRGDAIERTDTIFVDVPDVSDMSAWLNADHTAINVVITGVGLQRFSLHIIQS